MLLLVALAPFAMSFPPYPSNASTDSQQPHRVALILLGLTATAVALVECVAMARHARTDEVGFAPFAAAFLACAILGWRSYPYWATGVYQVGIGTFPAMDQDPKGMIPMLWMGDLWRLPVLLLYPLCCVGVPALSMAVVRAFRQRRFPAGVTTAICICIVVIFMLGFSPDYVPWLLD